MPRKKKAEAPENHERWLVSYADFITLLFAFFVVMFASSQADHGKAERVSAAVKEAFETDHVAAIMAAVLGGAVDKTGNGSAQMQGPGGTESEDEEREVEEPSNPQQIAELLPSLEVLSKELGEEVDNGQIQISMSQRGLVVSFAQTALFPSGDAEISSAAHDGLQKVALAIKKIPNPVRLEGHTDSRPINTSRYRSNWDLSAARSIALLEILTDQFGVPRRRLSVAGYAETAPVASNDTDAGRSRNRRVDLVILNERGMQGEPTKYYGTEPSAEPVSVSREADPLRAPESLVENLEAAVPSAAPVATVPQTP